MPVYEVTRVEDLATHSIARQRFECALALAAAGIYGLLAFTVNRRAHEIGVRIALGAYPQNVLALIMSYGMKLVVLGLAVGLAGSLMLTRLMSSLLFQVNPFDPLSLGIVTLILAAIAALACFLPARRAMRVDPVVALRVE